MHSRKYGQPNVLVKYFTIYIVLTRIHKQILNNLLRHIGLHAVFNALIAETAGDTCVAGPLVSWKASRPTAFDTMPYVDSIFSNSLSHGRSMEAREILRKWFHLRRRTQQAMKFLNKQKGSPPLWRSLSVQKGPEVCHSILTGNSPSAVEQKEVETFVSVD